MKVIPSRISVYILVNSKWPGEILTSKTLNILLEWNKILLLQTCKLSYFFQQCLPWLKIVSKCFVTLCQKLAISTADCCMESICYNTEIPAVIVCPERDYRIFLNWSSIHLSIKTQPKARNVKGVSSAPEAFTMPNRIVRTSPLKRFIFWIFIIPVVPCFYITLYQILLAFTMWKQWNMWSSMTYSTRPLVTSQAPVILVTSSGCVELYNGFYSGFLTQQYGYVQCYRTTIILHSHI